MLGTLSQLISTKHKQDELQGLQGLSVFPWKLSVVKSAMQDSRWNWGWMEVMLSMISAEGGVGYIGR